MAAIQVNTIYFRVSRYSDIDCAVVFWLYFTAFLKGKKRVFGN